jgi:N-acetylmuramoyl-L-alanine amidase
MLKRFLIIAGLTLLNFSFFIFNFSFASDVSHLVRVEMHRNRGYDYLDIYTTSNVNATGLLLENQLWINFPATQVSDQIKILRRSSKRIKNLHVIQADPQTARVIIDLKTDVDYDIVNVFGWHKTVVELGGRIDYASKHLSAMEKTTAAPPLKPIKIEPAKKVLLPLTGRTIIIDPGHGGNDPGAVSANGLPEKNYTLLTAQKVAGLLKEAGATVYLTRNSDRTNSLQEIVAFANQTKADIFISIHYNYADSASIQGAETYYCSNRSRRLALLLHQNIIEEQKSRDRGLRQAPYYVIRHIVMPSVLLEPLYLSNPNEAEKVRSSGQQTELAEAIVRGVKSYFRSRSN